MKKTTEQLEEFCHKFSDQVQILLETYPAVDCVKGTITAGSGNAEFSLCRKCLGDKEKPKIDSFETMDKSLSGLESWETLKKECPEYITMLKDIRDDCEDDDRISVDQELLGEVCKTLMKKVLLG